MTQAMDVSVVISTYNGAAVLPRALDAVLDQEVGNDLHYEVIVVDNNSTDDTRSVIESYVARAAGRMRYVFEGRQGLSYGRNAGIQAARAPIVAFTDDDVRVARDWVATLKALLDEHPEVDYVGGRVLPQWSGPPPAWLTDAHWSPLALVDYGAEPIYVNPDRQLCLVGANIAMRRALFDLIGLFEPELQRVKDSIGSMEDHELVIRCWRAGRQGLYAPNLIASTVVRPERMLKAYHRRWHSGHGAFCAKMRYNEDVNGEGRYIGKVAAERVTLFGVPGFLYRQLVREAGSWARASLQRRPDLALSFENSMRFLVSYIRTRYRDEKGTHGRSPVAEIGGFATGLVRKKVRTAMRRRQGTTAGINS
jgi:glycosyltransferase involved in cell wall biosynthesis